MALDLRADLYEACQQISPRYPDYATLPIEDGFDWSSLSRCSFERLYLVAFRSVWRPEADLDLLREHDDRAYQEALKIGGLLRYFKGHANERGEYLSVLPLGDARAGQERRRRHLAPLRRSRHRADVLVLYARPLLGEEAQRKAHLRAALKRFA